MIETRRDSYLAWLHELIAFSDLICQSRDKPFFHFVQPNQYDRGAKPLSAEERDRFTRNTTRFDEVTPRDSSVDSTDLGDVFARTAETGYVDDCCHPNEHGVALLAAAIDDHVLAASRPRTRAAPPARARSIVGGRSYNRCLPGLASEFRSSRAS